MLDPAVFVIVAEGHHLIRQAGAHTVLLNHQDGAKLRRSEPVGGAGQLRWQVLRLQPAFDIGLTALILSGHRRYGAVSRDQGHG